MKIALILLVLSYTVSMAQNPPSGIYVSAGPTNPTNSSVKQSNANFSFVKGVLVRINWADLEPSNDNFDWSLVQNQIDSANVYGKKISLAIGAIIPNWLTDSVQMVSYRFGNVTDSIVVPWDSIFMNKWADLIQNIGNQFNADTTISLVYITNSSFNGFEMQLPSTVTPSWSSLGYTDQKMIDSWKSAIDAFNTSFPGHFLSNDYHPINGSNIPTDSIYQYAVQTIGTRYGASAWWWSQNNTSVYPSQYQVLQNSALSSFATVQVARNGTNDSDLLGAGGLQGTLQQAISDNICYWEIWEIDIKNSHFHSLFDTISCQSAMTSAAKYQIYPIPFQDVINISNLKGNEIINIYYLTGSMVTSLSTNKNIDLSYLPSGIYIVEIIDENQNYQRIKVIKK